MDFHYGTSFGKASPEAYERLLLDAMSGDATLFARRDEVEEAWAFIDIIENAWSEKNERAGAVLLFRQAHGDQRKQTSSWPAMAALGGDSELCRRLRKITR